MNREEITQICEREVLEPAARLFGTSKAGLIKIPDSEGCANLVYEYQRNGQARILRLSYNPDRPVEQIQAELHFINHLAEGGVRVSLPILSEHGNLIEVLPAAGIPFIAVSFVKGRGMRMPDNDYRYRVDAPIEEYFQNWGQVLGQMHRLCKNLPAVEQCDQTTRVVQLGNTPAASLTESSCPPSAQNMTSSLLSCGPYPRM